MNPLVDPKWLRATTDDIVIADVRWYIDGRSGRDAYDRGHIPGAVFIDLDTDLSAPPGPSGRHPLPSPTAFAEVMRAAGVRAGVPVIAYDDAGGGIAARLWWMLDSLGHPAAVLDGGLQHWDGELTTEVTTPTRGTFEEQPWPEERFVSADDVSNRPAATVLIDARSNERYRGEPNDIDPRFGHIPGAKSLPWTDNLVDGRLRPPSELRERFTASGVDVDTDAVVYCGSGVTACNDLLALRVAGHERARLYVGSWSEWGADSERPVVRDVS